ncbi:Universal stress protein UspA [Labilithrix luteola]|uniref:Universal stress protein UspA n=1 Tax=Labilithrix luteola TaxID=1391654 RepID=A0A0K1PVG7_9BACT|nr:universal stress protein [Labilithrix luteola]AKU97522.1 Universal stress protein UspA [Labilithrix luteola]
MTNQQTASSRVVILAAVDETENANDVVRTASMLARTLAGAEVHLAHVIFAPASLETEASLARTDLVEGARSMLDRNVAEARKYFDGRIVGHLAVGGPQREILQLASSLVADVVVVGGSRKGKLERFVLGSVSEQIVRKASCAVLVARPKDYANVVPEIEPPCPACEEVQRASNGTALWCAAHRHTTEHAHGRLHYEFPPSFGLGSMLIRPDK